MKKLFLIVILFALGCGDPSADTRQAAKTKVLMAEAEAQIGMPNITNFQQRKFMKLIFELLDQENVETYTYLKSDYTGKPIFVGKSIGYGIPFSAQFTNPERVTGYGPVPQADPNGLFMPTSSSATWIMMVNPVTKKPQVMYIEPEILVSPFPLHEEQQ